MNVTPFPSPGDRGLGVVELLGDYQAHLIARNASPYTIAAYKSALRDLDNYAKTRGHEEITGRVLEAWVTAVMDATSASNARSKLRQVRDFFRWREREYGVRSPTPGVREPTAEDPPVPCLDFDQLHRLMETTRGQGFREVRDRAIIRLLIDNGIRTKELLSITADAFDWQRRVVRVYGKGGRARDAPFGRRATTDVKRYMTARARLGTRPEAFWVNSGGHALTRRSIQNMILRRGAQAGIMGLHPHALRHTFAHMWLEGGGSELGLMRIGGWSNKTVMRRYGASLADRRARREHEARSPGDLV